MSIAKWFSKKTLEDSQVSLAEVEQLLKEADVAEDREIPEPYLSAGAEYVEYQTLSVKEWRDGVWYCCKKHENPLVHFKGIFPFKRLACGTCNHVLCPDCETTDMIVPLGAETPDVKDAGTELRLFQVCSSCGLSHRAEVRRPDHRGKRFCWVPMASKSHSDMCPCGAAAQFDWLKYKINIPWMFRLQSVQEAHNAKMRLTDRQRKTKETSKCQAMPQFQRASTESHTESKKASTHRATPQFQRASTYAHHMNTQSIPRGNETFQLGAVAPSRPQMQRANQSHLNRSDALPAAGRPEVARADTWATADQHRRVYEAFER
ncbi:hypothetical protein E8E13_007769 [Curvularia kusanoi]|uniref:Probable double zinc ribbon domain-containing protein n=1 Tax=Curvularia kusanoi TaxID=90978 RepID=A0A9P4TI23_CURKU|nr:hypothetical protein E8E13_007769 [Curvularia kusanoi]